MSEIQGSNPMYLCCNRVWTGVYVWVCVGGVPGGAECHPSIL